MSRNIASPVSKMTKVSMAISTLVLIGSILAILAFPPAAEAQAGGPLVSPEELRKLTGSVDRIMNFMAGIGIGITVISVVWAGITYMAEPLEERPQGTTRAALIGAVIGLVTVLSAKGITLVITPILEGFLNASF